MNVHKETNVTLIDIIYQANISTKENDYNDKGIYKYDKFKVEI